MDQRKPKFVSGDLVVNGGAPGIRLKIHGVEVVDGVAHYWMHEANCESFRQSVAHTDQYYRHCTKKQWSDFYDAENPIPKDPDVDDDGFPINRPDWI
jgi:hypothetical protein